MVVPLSRLDNSNTSSTNWSRWLLPCSMIVVYSFDSSSSSEILLLSICEKPTMELSGVRISWLIFCMNSVFIRLALCSASLARRRTLLSRVSRKNIMPTITTMIHNRMIIYRRVSNCISWFFCINSLFSKLRCSIPKMVANSPTAISSWALFSESLSSKAFS